MDCKVPAPTDGGGGKVECRYEQTTISGGQSQSRVIKSYAVTTPKQGEALTDLTATDEAGLPDVQVAVWHGLYVPAKTSHEVVPKLTEALQVALVDHHVLDTLAHLGTTPGAPAQVTPEAPRGNPPRQIEPANHDLQGARVQGGGVWNLPLQGRGWG